MAASRSYRRWWIGVARFAVTVTCLALLLTWIDPREVWREWSNLPIASLLAVLVCHGLIIGLLGWRWRSIVGAFASPPSIGYAVHLNSVTTFLNLVLPLSVGGDIGRVWLGHRSGIGLATGTLVAVLDRVVGLIGLGLLLIVAAIAAPSEWLPWEARLVMAAVMPAALVVLWALPTLAGIGSGRWMARWIDGMGHQLRGLRGQLRSLLLVTTIQSLAAHLLAVVIVVMIADGLGLALSLGDALLLVPAILLAAMLPFSIGGWGVREAAAISLLGLAGVPAAGALALSLLFGLTQLAVSGVGVVIWSAFGHARHKAAPT